MQTPVSHVKVWHFVSHIHKHFNLHVTLKQKCDCYCGSSCVFQKNIIGRTQVCKHNVSETALLTIFTGTTSLVESKSSENFSVDYLDNGTSFGWRILLMNFLISTINSIRFTSSVLSLSQKSLRRKPGQVTPRLSEKYMRKYLFHYFG